MRVSIKLNYSKGNSLKLIFIVFAEKIAINFHGRKHKSARPNSSREITVYKGDQVTINKAVNENWIECETKGRIGIVPKTYLELDTNPFRVSNLRAIQKS